jgi:hypothetical protein
MLRSSPAIHDVIGVHDDRAIRRLDVPEHFGLPRIVAEAIASVRAVYADPPLDGVSIGQQDANRALGCQAVAGGQLRFDHVADQRHLDDVRPVVQHGIGHGVVMQFEGEEARDAVQEVGHPFGTGMAGARCGQEETPGDGRSRRQGQGGFGPLLLDAEFGHVN